MADLLPYSATTHAHLKKILHPELQAQIDSRTAVKYLRFLREVELDHLALPRHVYGRWVPDVPVHPAHLVLSTLRPGTFEWETVREVDLEPDPRIWGEGLSQSMTIAEMNAHFKQILADSPAQVIALNGLRTSLLRVECDREYPVWPNHGENQGNRYQVPFGTLNPLQAFGRVVGLPPAYPAIAPILQRGRIEPQAPAGCSMR